MLTCGHWRFGGVAFTARTRLAHHVASDQMAIEDVSSCRDKSTAMTHTIQSVSMYLQMPLTVGLGSECGQANHTDKWTLTWGTDIHTVESNIREQFINM